MMGQQTEIRKGNDMSEHAMMNEITLLKDSLKNEIASLNERTMLEVAVLQEHENALKNECMVLVKDIGMSKRLDEEVRGLTVNVTVPDSPFRQLAEYDLPKDGSFSSEEETWQMM